MDLLTLTVREGAATEYPTEADAVKALAQASEDFPDYTLLIERKGEAFVIATVNMAVQRWLRA